MIAASPGARAARAPVVLGVGLAGFLFGAAADGGAGGFDGDVPVAADGGCAGAPLVAAAGGAALAGSAVVAAEGGGADPLAGAGCFAAGGLTLG